MITEIREYISPFFLNRHYIVRDIKYVLKKYRISGRLLDFGCGSMPYSQLFTHVTKYEGIDYHNYSINKDFKTKKPDYFFDKDYSKKYTLTFASNTFDTSASFQVLEHHPEPQLMLQEMVRVTKRGGYILLTAPFIWGEHEKPHDYQRFTEFGIQRLCQPLNVEIVEFIKEGTFLSTISMLLNQQVNNFSAQSKLHLLIGSLIYFPLLVFQYTCLILDKILKPNDIYINYLILLKKK